MDLSYILNHLGEDRAAYFNAVAPPVVQSSNFAFSDLEDMRNKFSDELSNHVYSRGNNPTVEILRKKIAALEHAEDCLVFSSGAAAIAMAVIANVKSGDHIVCVKSPYSWTANLLKKFLSRFNISHTFVDGKHISEIEKAIQENTTVLLLESPNTLFFELQDLRACAILAKEKGITTIIDNSHCSPIFQNPLEFGIDIVVHSGTKYINGHSDVVVGLLCSSREMVQKIFQSEFMTLGAILSPHDANLVIRGLRTLELRVKKSDSSAAKIAEWLYQQKQVEKIFFPFHPSFEQYELAKSQMSGCGGLITVQFKTDSMIKMENFVHALEHFLIAVSWGGHESLMMPTIGFYNIKGRDSNLPIPWNTVRFYIGLEDPDWLIKDLENAMKLL
ncbi:MAG: trans-sulfuration enzyme family protein [Saprospiraceae bacterium]